MVADLPCFSGSAQNQMTAGQGMTALTTDLWSVQSKSMANVVKSEWASLSSY
jgi:hypothetical protein